MNKLYTTSILCFLLLPGLAACSKADTVSDAGARLLSLRVNSSRAIEVSAFNETLAMAGKAGEAWAKDPVSIIRRLIDWGREREAVMAFKGPGKLPVYYKFVVISNGYHDDSIQGERYDIELEQDASQQWRVKSAAKSWRCWPGRGHENYGVEPCS